MYHHWEEQVHLSRSYVKVMGNNKYIRQGRRETGSVKVVWMQQWQRQQVVQHQRHLEPSDYTLLLWMHRPPALSHEQSLAHDQCPYCKQKHTQIWYIVTQAVVYLCQWWMNSMYCNDTLHWQYDWHGSYQQSYFTSSRSTRHMIVYMYW